MKLFVYVPEHPNYGVLPETRDSLSRLEWDDAMELVFSRGRNTHFFPNINTCNTYERARQMMLGGDYDAMLTVEADMIIPPDAARLLSQVDGDVIYGLYCWRYNQHWNAQQRLDPFGGWSYSAWPPDAKAVWGKGAFPVAGAGQGCTFYHRRVLEKVPFRLFDGDEGTFAQDWPFAWDCQTLGFKQMATTDVVCGHVDLGENAVYWPDITQPTAFRQETYTHGN